MVLWKELKTYIHGNLSGLYTELTQLHLSLNKLTDFLLIELALKLFKS